MIDFKPGTVTLVGGGPGSPDLITVAGLRAIQEADVILYDRLAPVELLDTLPQEVKLINVGKIPRGESTSQEAINEQLVRYARQGKVVVRLKGGDSFVFGRGGEEWQACLEAGVEVQVIPGVSSSVAAPALAGIPLTHRGLAQGFTVVSGHVPPDDPRCTIRWDLLAKSNTTLVILMGVKYLPEITQKLIDGGMAPQTPAAIVAKAATPEMQSWHGDLGSIAQVSLENQVCPPAITVIGEVARLDLLNSVS